MSNMRKCLLFGCVLIFAGVLNHAQPGPHIQGQSPQGWTIDVQGSRGTFTASGQAWSVEVIFDWLGQTGFVKTLVLVGRQPDSYLLNFALVNFAGEEFVVWHYDYKKRLLVADRFQGSYDISGLTIQPTPVPGYVPLGKVPDYSGQDFRVDSQYAQVTPVEGRVSYEDLSLIVYPVYNAEVGGAFYEFWAIGIDPRTQQTYHLIFYSDRPQAWVIDLWSSEVSILPLGQAILLGRQVQVTRSVTLGNKL
jgi:hypothetical protein